MCKFFYFLFSLQKVMEINSFGQNFGLFAEENKREDYSYQALLGTIEPTLLSRLFFSSKNMDIIQNKVIADIYERSNKLYRIDKQPETELLIIMRSVFLQYSQNLPNQITEQIERLNEITYRKVIEKIYPNLLSYIAYLRDSSQMYQPMELPTNSSSAGSGNKILPGNAVALFGTEEFKDTYYTI